MKIFLFLLLITHFSLLTIDAQVTQEWVARYNGPGNGNDVAYSLAVDGSGNVYVTGGSTGSGTIFDYATIKYNSASIQQWVSRYNGPENYTDIATSIAIDGSGNVNVTGSIYGNETQADYATIRYNSSGVQQWVARYNGTGNDEDYANSIAVDGSGNVYVTGRSMGLGTGWDYATLKYNSSGVQQWVQRYNGPGNDEDYVYSIALDGSGNVYVTGESDGIETISDYATIKYNSAGSQQWVQRYNGPGNNYDGASSLAVDGSGNVYVTGGSEGIGTSADCTTIKYNTSGDSLWVARYNGPYSADGASSLALDGSGNVYVTGASEGIGTNFDYVTIKYNSTGVQQWASRYNGPGNFLDIARSLAVDGSGNVYVTGSSAAGGGNIDYATIKYNSAGVQQWLQRYNGPGNSEDFAYSLALDGSGNVYVTGESAGGIVTGYDYATIKYSQMVGITPISNETPNQFSLSQNYPNPFNPMTKIKFEIPNSKNETNSKTEIRIYDVLGKEVAILVNDELKPGKYEVEFDGSNYPSGVYYYKFVAGGYEETKRMVLIK